MNELELPGEPPLRLNAKVVRVEHNPSEPGWGCGSSSTPGMVGRWRTSSCASTRRCAELARFS